MSSRVPSEKLTLVAVDGRRLPARWWPGAEAAERSVVFLAGLAAPQDYLRWFAAYLAGEGWGVLTFDYRSVGARNNLRAESGATADDWVNLDIPAAVEEVRRRTKTRFLAVVAHSIGGQLLGQSPVRTQIDGALLIGAQRGIPRLFRGIGHLRVLYAYAVFPVLIRLLGYLPTSRLTLPESCSGGVLRQWVRWGRTGVFTDSRGVDVENRFLDYKNPLTAVTVADDDYYAPPAAVEALTRLYARALVRRQTLVPADFGLRKLEHFGLFHPRAPRALWSKVEGWLRQLEEARLQNSFGERLPPTPAPPRSLSTL